MAYDARRFWPVVVYGIVVFCNTDAIIALSLLLRIPSDLMLFVIPPAATLELCYSFWFWGWLVQRAGDLEKVREARRQLKKEGLLDRWVIDGVLRVYRSVVHPENGTRRRIVKYGVWAVWAAGLNPIPGFPTRGPCGAFLGVFQSRRHFYHLLVANLVHVLYVICGVSWVLGR